MRYMKANQVKEDKKEKHKPQVSVMLQSDNQHILIELCSMKQSFQAVKEFRKTVEELQTEIKEIRANKSP